MAVFVNANRPERWKQDVAHSVDFYNRWFLEFAPSTYRETRLQVVEQVKSSISKTSNLTDVTPEILEQHPEVLQCLRMATSPPLARDRLIGLAGVKPSLVRSMEQNHRLPLRMSGFTIRQQLQLICQVVTSLVDKDIFPWLDEQRPQPTDAVIHLAATIVADRLTGANADPLIRNAQEHRQLVTLQAWLENHGYRLAENRERTPFQTMKPGTFAFRMNVQVTQQESGRLVNIPIDAVIMPKSAIPDSLPILLEAKSAGDYTNTNKRRKEEAIKIAQLRHTYGDATRFVLLLCGYFDSGYLGYEAAEGIDWVWEHRIDDLGELGI